MLKKTAYFYKRCGYNNADNVINSIIKEKEDFIVSNRMNIKKIEDESLRVDHIGSNQAMAIIKLSYFEK